MSTSPSKPDTVAVKTVFRKATVEQPVEKVKNGLVEYGKDNLYPQTLWGYYYDSPIHGGIVNQKQIFVFGDGVEVEGVTPEQAEQIQNNAGSKFTLDEVIEAVALDFEVQEYFYLLFKKQPTGVWAVSTISAELMRPREDFVYFEYSEDWGAGSQTYEKTSWCEYKSIFHVGPNDQECVMYVKTPAKQINLGKGRKRELTTSTFPIPKYSGSMKSILADIRMNQFHLSEVTNGWKNNTIVNLNNGIPEPNKQREIIDEMHQELSDPEHTGGVTFSFNDGQERAVTVENIGGNNNDTRYLLTQEHLRDQIMQSHSVQSPELFAVLVPGRLGGNTNLDQDFKRFNRTYVRKRRRTISDAIEEGFRLLNGWNIELVWKDWQPEWISSPSQDPSVEVTLREVTPDEMIAKFDQYGADRSLFRFIHSKGTHGVPEEDAEFVAEFMSQKFTVDLTPDQNRILQLISQGESYKAIVDAIDKGAQYVSSNLLRLKAQGLYEAVDGTWELTAEGQESVTTEEMISVLYTYEKRPDVDGPDILPGGRTRSFCENLINLNRAYTRDEINAISASVGRDVWLYRGGWYHDPKTDTNRPSCRHFWKQNIVLG